MRERIKSLINLCNRTYFYSTCISDHCHCIQGLYRGAKNNEMRLGVCSRTNDVIEPLIKPQWYVNCKGMAKEALDAVMSEERKIEIIPSQYAAEWRR